jgi:von Willebrand factor type A domain.
MKGEKLEMAKKGVELLVESLPNDSKVTLISFNENVEVHNEFSEPSGVDLDELHKIKVGSGTALYKALETAFRLSKDHQLPSYVILLTDGIPSDMGCMQGIRMKFNLEKCLQVYQSLEVPENVEIISFGIGEDYSEEILKALSDRGRGYFYHVKDPSEIPERMPKLAKSQVSAKNLVVTAYLKLL